jgi:uncharacterized membrane protein
MQQKTKILILLCSILFGFFILSSVLMAQSAPAGTPNSQDQAVSSSDHDEESDENKATAGAPKPVPIPFSSPIKDYLHNKIVHFPLALGIAGSLFVLISLKKPEMLTAARILWFLAAVTAVGAYFSGHAQEGEFEHGAMQNILEIHKNLGIVSAVGLWVGFLLTLSRRFRGLSVVVAILVLLAVSVAGYYGGLLAHS